MDRLKPRELEVVELRCGPRELNTKEAAAALGLSRHTANTHSRRVIRKLGAKTFYGVCERYGEEEGKRLALAGMRAELV